MRFLWIAMLLMGFYFLASASTEQGLLPSGHGTGRASEIIIGAALVIYSIYRLFKK